MYPAIQHPNSTSVKSVEEYQSMYEQSINDPDTFWSNQAKTNLTWFQPFLTAGMGSFKEGDVNWFSGGKINISYNCIDRHLKTRANQPALVWEGDEPGLTRTITYLELSHEVCRIANFMKGKGIKKGDVVTVYMPMIPEIAMVLLACTRIGAIHSVVFAGFSAASLADRVQNCSSKFIFTADQGLRGGRVIPLKDTVNQACLSCPQVQNVFVFKRTSAEVVMIPERDIFLEDVLPLVSFDAALSWWFTNVLSCLSCLVLSYYRLSCGAYAVIVLSYRLMSFLIISHPIISCPLISCPLISCPLMSCHIAGETLLPLRAPGQRGHFLHPVHLRLHRQA
jgi:acetyl-CoA synthetase